MRPGRRIRNLVSSIRSRRMSRGGPSDPPLKKLRAGEKLASNDMYTDLSTNDDECTYFDYVSIAKKAFLKEPTRSCLKKPDTPSRTVRVRFEGQKKAWVPKSLMKRRAEAKQKAVSKNNEMALVTVSTKVKQPALPSIEKPCALLCMHHKANHEPSTKKEFKPTLPQRKPRRSDHYDVVPNTTCTVEEIGNEMSSDEESNEAFSAAARVPVSQNNCLENVMKRMGIFDSYAYMFASSDGQEDVCDLFSFDEIPSSCSETDYEVSECISSDYDEIEKQFSVMEEEISRLVDVEM